ncbi:MAG: adenosylcobinamide amidohydrolase [Halobacteriaceae archaeon]
MFETAVSEGVLRLRRPGTRWLSTGPGGGFERADAAYNVAVPEGFERTDIPAYVAERRERAGFADSGPALLTGVEMRHARGARLGPAVAYATVGLSNPAALPQDPADTPAGGDSPTSRPPGTVNLLVGTTRALDSGAMATLLGVAVEAKAATLLTLAGVPGTTTDAAVVACDPGADTAAFAGSATDVGAATRACVREAVRAGFAARYAGGGAPDSVADAEHGVVTDERAEVFEP